MMENDACYTRETALEKAIEMEMRSFQVYQKAYHKARDPVARDLIRDLALDELRHKHTLEKALFEETVALHDTGFKQELVMKLNLILDERPLDVSATEKDVLTHAVNDERRAVDFYEHMAEQCAGMPAQDVFKRLSEDEEGHLARLEKLYQERYGKP